jgi:uncharacterized protein (TIGR03435 family)
MPGGRISAPNTTLRELIHQAYGVDDDLIFGGPDWINSARFAVEASRARGRDAIPAAGHAGVSARRAVQRENSP